jgi:hypothetical protein
MGRKRKEQLEELDTVIAEEGAHNNGHDNGNGKLTIEDLADTVNQLARAVQMLTARSTSDEGDAFAPDDADLREQAEADAAALTSDTSLQINPLGKDEKKSKASEMLVNAMFNTPREKLDEMTDVRNDLEAAAFAGVRTFNMFIGKAFVRRDGEPPVLLSDMFLDNIERLKRSIGGKHLMRAMAMSQIEKEKEEARENSVVFGGMGSE